VLGVSTAAVQQRETGYLRATGAYALGTALLSAAEADAPPALARGAHARLKRAVTALGAALAAVAPKQGYSPEAVRADTTLDACCSALFHWLDGWARLPEAPEAASASAVLKDIFPKGLDFTQLVYPDQWAESESRLQRIVKLGHDKTVRALGGTAILERLQSAHKAYGLVLGITTAPEAPERNEAARRAPLDAVLDALREYVLKVAAQAEKDDPASEALRDRLLAPLTELRARSRTPIAAEGVVTPPDAPKPV